MIGGAASCGITHTAVVPLDLVKVGVWNFQNSFVCIFVCYVTRQTWL